MTGCVADAHPRATTVAPVARPSASAPTPTPSPTFDRSARSLSDPASIWVVVDKLRPLRPKTLVPRDLTAVRVPHTNPPMLRRAAAAAARKLFAAAARDSLALVSNSTYRPFDDQRRIYDADRARLGLAGADRLTARPGYSEHQTGLAMDIGAAHGGCNLDPCFAATPEGRWLARNAWRFGFVLRYPKGEERETGIEFEPWHYRYVGTPLARELHVTGTPTLEQFFGLPASPSYG
jgi:D-alanyl-D-alanine carboxypeptidase